MKAHAYSKKAAMMNCMKSISGNQGMIPGLEMEEFRLPQHFKIARWREWKPLLMQSMLLRVRVD